MADAVLSAADSLSHATNVLSTVITKSQHQFVMTRDDCIVQAHKSNLFSCKWKCWHSASTIRFERQIGSVCCFKIASVHISRQQSPTRLLVLMTVGEWDGWSGWLETVHSTVETTKRCQRSSAKWTADPAGLKWPEMAQMKLVPVCCFSGGKDACLPALGVRLFFPALRRLTGGVEESLSNKPWPLQPVMSPPHFPVKRCAVLRTLSLSQISPRTHEHKRAHMQRGESTVDSTFTTDSATVAAVHLL